MLKYFQCSALWEHTRRCHPYWNLLFPWIISLFSPDPSTPALSTRELHVPRDTNIGVMKHSEWVSQIARKCWIKRDSFMLLASVFLHLYFIDPCYEKRQIIFPELFQCILQIRKSQLHVSHHQFSLCTREHIFFPSCNQSLQNSASIRDLPKDIYMREQCKAMSLPEQGLVFPIFV